MVGMETLRCPTCVTLLPDPDARRCPACHTKLRKRRGGPVVLGESNRLSGRSLPVDVELRVRAEARYETYEPKPKADEPLEAVFAFAPSEPVEPPPLARAEPEPLDLARLDGAPVDVPVAGEPIVLEHDEHPMPVEPPVAAQPLSAEPLAAEPLADLPDPALPESTMPEPEPAPVVALDPVEPEPAAAEPIVPAPVAREPEVAEPEVAEPEVAEPAPVFGRIDLTEEPEPAAATIDLTSEVHSEPEPDPAVRPLSGWRAVPPRGASSPLDGTLNEMVEELHRKARADAGKPQTR